MVILCHCSGIHPDRGTPQEPELKVFRAHSPEYNSPVTDECP
jgi:hypothetical protein